MKNKLAAFFLLMVAALWGLSFPLVEASMKTQDPFIFVSLRFSLAALPALPFVLKNIDRKTLLVGTVLGAIQCGAYIFQTLGLQTVNASRAAFLTGIYVLLVPFIIPLFRMGKPTLHDMVSGLICLTGIYVLTGCKIGGMTLGDGWIIVCDMFIAVSLIYIGCQSKDGMNPYMLAFVQIVMTALFSWIPTLLFSDRNFAAFATTQAITSLAICSFFVTMLAFVLQSKYQKFVTIQYTALIFSLEPVFGALFDTALTSTPPTLYTIFGGLIIVASILYLELCKPKVLVPLHP